MNSGVQTGLCHSQMETQKRYVCMVIPNENVETVASFKKPSGVDFILMSLIKYMVVPGQMRHSGIRPIRDTNEVAETDTQ